MGRNKGDGKLIFTVLMLGAAGASYAYLQKNAPGLVSDFRDLIEDAPNWSARMVVNAYKAAAQAAVEKAEHLEYLERDNDKLAMENAHLRLELEAMRYNKDMKMAREDESHNARSLEEMTGTREGRTLASIGYRPPTHMLPSQLNTLAVSYFKAGEYEKSVVILRMLTRQDDNDGFKTARNFVMSGVAFYKLKNYVEADKDFDDALRTRETADNVPYHAQARLWKAIVAQRMDKPTKTQYWLNELVDNHPHSTEAAWVNHPEQGHARKKH